MTEPDSRLARELDSLLDTGADRAPAYLAEAVAHRTRVTRQRPGFLAAALNAPTFDTRADGGAVARRIAVVAALITALLVLLTLASGGGPRPRLASGPTGTPTSASPGQVPPPPSATLPTSTPIGLRSPISAAAAYRDPILGFAIDLDPSGPDIQSVQAGPLEGPVVTLLAPPCPVFIDARACAEINVSTGPVGSGGVAIDDGAGGTRRIDGSTLDELLAAWQAARGPATREALQLDGLSAILARSGSDGAARVSALALRGGRLWVIETSARGFLPSVDRARFLELLASWRWVRPPVGFSYRHLTYPATANRPGFSVFTNQTSGYTPGSADPLAIAVDDTKVCPGQSGFAAAICLAEGGGQAGSYVTVTASDGTLDEAVAALENGRTVVYSRLGTHRCVLLLPHDFPAIEPIALVEYGPTIWTLRGHDTASPGSADGLERFLVTFEPGL